MSYDRANTIKISNIFALTWLIFAGPVTLNIICTTCHIIGENSPLYQMLLSDTQLSPNSKGKYTATTFTMKLCNK